MKSDLTQAEAALARGDYGQCLTFLEPLAENNPLPGNEGSQIRMLMVTAFMGLGNEEKAISLCKLITQCKNDALRQRAKQLLKVLEAPSLQRPDNWSINLPSIEMKEITHGKTNGFRGKSTTNQAAPPVFPPTGPTQSLSIGFSIFTLVVLVFLTYLLSGCARIATEITLSAGNNLNLA